jgi:SAM-dependent methyltransferase
LQSAHDFWRARHQRSGHTGWNDPVIYAYDQLERLAFVQAELDRLACTAGHALDFGCGSGDFSKALLARGLRVSGYDPYVRPAIESPRFEHLDSLDALAAGAGGWDLILSVTVLDHVLDLAELRAILGVLRAGIRAGGRLLLIEYSLDESEAHASDYQAFRTEKEWHELLCGAGWKVERVQPLPHPERAPSQGYRAYQRRWPVRLVQRFGHRLPIAKAWLGPLLEALARRDFARFGLGSVSGSPLKLHVCQPVSS